MAKSTRDVETAEPIAPGMAVESKDDPEQARENEKPVEDDSSEYTYEPGIITKKRCCLCCVLIALIAGIVCALYFPLGREKATQEVSKIVGEQPTAAPTSQLFANIVDLLTPYTPQETLVDSTTPQGQALRQLVAEVEESGEEPIPHRILQRYALMTLYSSTNPSRWKTSTGWQTFTGDECEWFGIGTCRYLEDGTYGVANIELGKFSMVRLAV